MPLTFEDLTREILAELGALDASNVASNEDAVRVAQRAPTVYLDLVAARVVPLFSLATIPEPYFPGLVRIIAEYLAPSFGRPTKPEVVAEAQSRLAAIYRLDRAGGMSSLALAVLERLEAIGGNTLAQDPAAVALAIDRTLIDLKQRRIIDIPHAATVAAQQFDPLVTVVSARINQKAVDPAVALAAEQRLMQIDRLDKTKGSALSRQVMEQLSAWDALTPAVDHDAVLARIPAALAELATSDVVYFGAEKDISLQATPSVVRYIAAGLSPKPLYDVLAAEKANLRLIRPPIEIGPEPVLSEYY
jgi:hypothetical protein